MTSSTPTPVDHPRPGRLRTIIFRTASALTLALFAFAIPNLLTPWVGIDFQHDGVIQRWRDAIEGTVDTLIWVALLGLALRPLARPLVAQMVVAVAALAASVLPAAGPAMLVTIGLVLLPVFTYPRPALLRSFHLSELDVLGTVIAVVAAAVLLPMALAVWSPSESQAATYAEHLAVLALAGLAMSTRLPGWRWIAWPTVAAWGYLGVVAIAFPEAVDSFGRVGGVASVVVAGAFAWASVRPVLRTRRAG